MTATPYCSQCHWSDNARCLLTGKPIVRDEDVCKHYVKLSVEVVKR